MDIAALIRSSRRSAALSQAELATGAGTSQSALARYESGVVLPTLPTLERLMLACGRSLQIRALPLDDRPPRLASARSRLGAEARHLRRHRGRLLEAAAAHGVRRIRVFGSVARGKSTPANDVDLLVDLEPGRTLLDLLAFQREARAILGTPVDVATSDMLKDRIRSDVLADALPL
jgi:predicted nucleotidyltransferase